MKKLTKTKSGIIVGEEEAAIRTCHCGYCPNMIFKDQEPQGRYFLKDGKPMCMVCRASKLSKFKLDIKKIKRKVAADTKARNAIAEKLETERINEIALRSVLEAEEHLASVSKKRKR